MTESSRIRSTGPATTQVRPKTEGLTQKKDPEGRPLLQFASPKRGKPPVHLADLTPAERIEKVKELGLPGFRAKQLATHYFTHSCRPARGTGRRHAAAAADRGAPSGDGQG